MRTLSTELRRQLERADIDARDAAEAGARVALEALAVQHHEPYGHMGSEQRTLRRRLRAHARQLGDRPDARSGGHGIEHLVKECAYEHWHGMLFARFLAENHLLIEPEMGVAITRDECEELARDEGVDKRMLAARFAHGMLPQVFRPDHPDFEVQFAREYRLNLEGLVEGLPLEVFRATNSLGWVYQFWQTKKKDEVNAAGNNIGADELPSVTQLYTEDYMVDFLLDNTLGAWHAGKVLAADSKLTESARSEDELRQAAGLPVEISPLHPGQGRPVDTRRRHVRRLAELCVGITVPRPLHGQRAFRGGDVRAAGGLAPGRGKAGRRRARGSGREGGKKMNQDYLPCRPRAIFWRQIAYINIVVRHRARGSHDDMA
jgi:hypothetical protein